MRNPRPRQVLAAAPCASEKVTPPHQSAERAGYGREHRTGYHPKRDSQASVRYSERVNSSKSSFSLQRTDRDGIVGQEPGHFETQGGCSPSALRRVRLVDSTRQRAHEVERQLQAESRALARLIETNGLPVKKNVLDKVRKQRAGVSALVDFWWQTVWCDLHQMALTPRWQQWVEQLLLPLMYWQEQLSYTRCPQQKAEVALALKAIQDAFERHPHPVPLHGY